MMSNSEGVLQVVGELRVLAEVKEQEAIHYKKLLEEANANIRMLIDENSKLQARVAELCNPIDR